MWLFMLPGQLVCNLAGLPDNSDHRMILRMFVNTIVWGAILAWSRQLLPWRSEGQALEGSVRICSKSMDTGLPAGRCTVQV